MRSASAMGRIIVCPTSEALPSANTTGKWAYRGNELHEFCRLMVKDPANREAHLLAVDEEFRDTASGIDVQAALDGLTVLRCEPAYVLDVKKQTVRYLGENIHRAYGDVGPYEIPLSIDVEAEFEGIPVELDYKSGMYIGSVEDHWQRRICAMALMLFHNAPFAISRVAYIKEDGSIEPDGCEFSSMDIADWCATLVKAIDDVRARHEMIASYIMPPVVPGDEQCRYCPALRSCPYWTNFVKAMNDDLKAVELGTDTAPVSDEQLGVAWKLAKASLKRAEEVVEAIKLIASRQPILISDTHMISPKDVPRAYTDHAAERGMLIVMMNRLGLTESEQSAKLAALKKTRTSPTTTTRKRDSL